MPRPDYVCCVNTGIAERDVEGNYNPESGLSWCGRKAQYGEYRFLDPTHALLNARNQGRLLICPECAKALSATLEAGTWRA